jgi:hypothetical protein
VSCGKRHEGHQGGAASTAALDEHVALAVKADTAPTAAHQALHDPLDGVLTFDDADGGANLRNDTGVVVVFFTNVEVREAGGSRGPVPA